MLGRCLAYGPHHLSSLISNLARQHAGVRVRHPAPVPWPGRQVCMASLAGHWRPLGRTVGTQHMPQGQPARLITVAAAARREPQGAQPEPGAASQTWQEVLLRALRRTAQLLAGLLALAVALLAPAPYVVSHPAGLRAALGAVNVVAAPAVVHIDSVSAGWKRPLVIEGLRVVEPWGPALASHLTAPTGPAMAAQQYSGSGSREAGGSKEAADLSAAVSVGSGEEEVAGQAQGRVLLSAQRVRTVQPLWEVARTQWSQARAGAGAEAPGGDRAALQPAGSTLASAQAGPGQEGPEGNDSPVTAHNPTQDVQSVDIIVSRPQIDCSLDQQGDLRLLRLLRRLGLVRSPPPLAVPSPPAAAAAAAPGTAPAPAGTSAAAAAMAGAAEEDTEEDAAGPPSSAPASSSAAKLPGAGPRAGGSRAAAAAPAAQRPPSSLQVPSSRVGFTAEVRDRALNVYFADGALLVPTEARELLGPHLHLEVVRGAEALSEAAAAEAKAGAADPIIPPSVPAGAGRILTPVAVRLDSELLSARAHGWQTARGYAVLAEPARATLEFTPALSRHLLSRINPLLADVVNLKGQHTLQASVTAVGGVWPSAGGATLRIEPVRVAVRQGPALRLALEVARLGDSRLARMGTGEAQLSAIEATFVPGGRVESRRLDMRLALDSGRSVHLATWGSARFEGGVDAGSGDGSRGIDGGSSGGGAGGGGQVDFALCIPADTLSMLGLRGLPEEFGVPLYLRGSLEAPRLVGVARASRQVGQLLLRHQAGRLEGQGESVAALLRRQVVSGLQDRLGPDTSFRMPPPVE